MYAYRLLAVIAPVSGLAFYTPTSAFAFEHAVVGRPEAAGTDGGLVRSARDRPRHMRPRDLAGSGILVPLPDTQSGLRKGSGANSGQNGLLAHFHPLANGFRISSGLLPREAYRADPLDLLSSQPAGQGAAPWLQSVSDVRGDALQDFDPYFGVGLNLQAPSSLLEVKLDIGVVLRPYDLPPGKSKRGARIPIGYGFDWRTVSKSNAWPGRIEPVASIRVKYKF